MRKAFVIIICTLLVSAFTLTHAQSGNLTFTGTVTGNKTKIEAATVSLLKASDSALVKIAVTDKEGIFSFEKVTKDSFRIRIEAIGFQKYYSAAFSVSGNSYALPLITLAASDGVAGGVTVTSKRPLIENKIDKTVVNVDASPTNTGLTALEVLEKSPGVTIDNNDNISLKGKQGVIILIDGKQTYLSGQDLANYLKNLSANQLDQIEIMSQPSAKYDASGNSGIINIKTKKTKTAGFNGNISTSAIFAKYFKNTNSINLNWRKNKINLFANYGYSHWKGFNDLYLYRSSRSSRAADFDRYSDQFTHGRFVGNPQNFKLGADFFATKKTTVGAVVTGNIRDDKFTSESRADIYDSSKTFVQYNSAHSQNKDKWTNLGFNLNFQQKLDTAGTELTADADYVFYNALGSQFSNNYLYSPNDVLIDTKDASNPNPYQLRGNLPSDIKIYTFKSDFHHPMKKNATLEAGIKFSYVKTDNDAQYTLFDSAYQNNGGWKSDTSRSNHFIYKENINAAYVNLNKQLKKWGVQLGLRAEQTVADGNQMTQHAGFHKNYTKLFPTSYISYKMNDSNTFAISYGRRIERPDYQSLNPFQQQLDRYTYQQGNPLLQPQFSHNIELSYNFKGQLNVSVNYTAISDIINDVLITRKLGNDSNYTTFLTSENIASSHNIGLSVSYNKLLKKWWTINAYANVFNNKFKGVIDNEPINVNTSAANFNVSNQFTWGKGWSGEVSGWFNSRQLVSSAIVMKPMGTFSFGAGKQILKSKGTLRLNIRDPFYITSFRGITDLDKGITLIHNKWDNRRATLTFTYRFGKDNNQPSRRRNSASDDETNRVKGGGQQ